MLITVRIIGIIIDWRTDRHKQATPMTTMTTETIAAMPTTAIISNPAFIHTQPTLALSRHTPAAGL